MGDGARLRNFYTKNPNQIKKNGSFFRVGGGVGWLVVLGLPAL